MIGRERPPRDVAVIVADVGNLRESADVPQDLGPGQTQLHEREQGMPARQELRVITMLGRQVEGLIHRPGPLVAERCGDHRVTSAPASAAASTARTMLW